MLWNIHRLVYGCLLSLMITALLYERLSTLSQPYAMALNMRISLKTPSAIIQILILPLLQYSQFRCGTFTMLALRFMADLFLLLYLGGRTSFSTATNTSLSTAINDDFNMTSFEIGISLGQLSTSSYFESLASNFPYSIPYGQRQECDIYGPLCQTGSITVTKNLTNVTTATVLPCSSYLTLQSYHLRAVGDVYLGGYYQDHWYTSFGRSPQCTSLAQAYSRGQFTLSNCGNKNTVIKMDLSSDVVDPGVIPSLQQPPGMLRSFGMNILGTCCGNCTVDISEGRLYYFPDNTSTDCSSYKTYNSTLLPAGNLEKRAESIIANANIAVVSGNTLFVHILLFHIHSRF